MAVKGQKQPEEVKEKIRQSLLGVKHTKERTLKKANTLRGRKMPEEQRKKMIGRTPPKTAFKKGIVPWNKGTKGVMKSWNKGRTGLWKLSEEMRKNKKLTAPRGENHYNWRGGVTPVNLSIRASLEYKLWREAVFKRDHYTCVWCGDNKGGNLNADHIKPFALFPELRFAIDNGRTLCVPCHQKTDTFGSLKNYKITT